MYGPPPPPPPRPGLPTGVVALVGAFCLFIGGIGGCTIGYIAGAAPTPAEPVAAPTVTTSSATAPSLVPTSEPATQTPSPRPSSPSKTTRKAAPKKSPSPPPPPRNDPRFRTCAEANDRGYGPYFKDQDPEYDWYIDRDGDGVVCES